MADMVGADRISGFVLGDRVVVTRVLGSGREVCGLNIITKIMTMMIRGYDVTREVEREEGDEKESGYGE